MKFMTLISTHTADSISVLSCSGKDCHPASMTAAVCAYSGIGVQLGPEYATLAPCDDFSCLGPDRLSAGRRGVGCRELTLLQHGASQAVLLAF